MDAEEEDDAADGDAADGVGIAEADGVEEGEAEGAEGGEAGDEVDEVVLAVGGEGGGVDFPGGAELVVS